MKLFRIDVDRENLEKYLQELICDVTTPQEVGLLVEVLHTVQYQARLASEAELEKQKLQFPLWQKLFAKRS
ncbi:MAG: hypothetical protein WCA38_21730 [Candidatus Acidiferrales bacterium]